METVEGLEGVASLDESKCREAVGCRTKVSFVVAAHNAAGALPQCLFSLMKQTPVGCEVIVVDDGSSDATAHAASQAGARVVRLGQHRGVSAARNAGAREASGDLLIFADADVELPESAVERLLEALREETACVAMLTAPHNGDAVWSAYKNGYMHYTYSKLPEHVECFYTSCAAIRTADFWACGGFDERYRRPSIEDMALGAKLVASGRRIRLDKELQVRHLKRYSLAGVLVQGFSRSCHIVRLALRIGRLPAQTSSGSFILGIALVWAAVAAAGSAAVWPAAGWAAAATLVGAAAVNAALLRFFYRAGGPRLLAAAALLLVPDLWLHGLGCIWGGIGYLLGRRY